MGWKWGYGYQLYICLPNGRGGHLCRLEIRMGWDCVCMIPNPLLPYPYFAYLKCSFSKTKKLLIDCRVCCLEVGNRGTVISLTYHSSDGRGKCAKENRDGGGYECACMIPHPFLVFRASYYLYLCICEMLPLKKRT